MLDLTKHLLPDTAIVDCYSNMPSKFNEKLPLKTTEWDGHLSPMKIHCVDYAFLKLCDENPGIEHKNYLKIKPDLINISHFNLPTRYVVITTGFTVPVREFKVEVVNAVINYVVSKGLIPVFLGQTSTKTGTAFTIKGNFNKRINFDKGHNLIDKTSLLESAKIMHNSVATIGVDNGLLHLAGCTDTTIIGGFTTVNPEARMAIRNNELGWNYHPVTPETSLDCRYCQVKTNFLYGHNYMKCLHNGKSVDYLACTKQLTADKFIESMKKTLKV